MCVVYFTTVTYAGIRVNGAADGTGFLYPYTRTQSSKRNRNTSFLIHDFRPEEFWEDLLHKRRRRKEMYKNDGVWSSETKLLKYVNVCENQPKIPLPFLFHELLAYSAGQCVLRLILWYSSECAQDIFVGLYTEENKYTENFTLCVSNIHNDIILVPTIKRDSSVNKCLAKDWTTEIRFPVKCKG